MFGQYVLDTSVVRSFHNIKYGSFLLSSFIWKSFIVESGRPESYSFTWSRFSFSSLQSSFKDIIHSFSFVFSPNDNFLYLFWTLLFFFSLLLVIHTCIIASIEGMWTVEWRNFTHKKGGLATFVTELTGEVTAENWRKYR